DLDQAHTALADDGEPRVVAVVRDLDADREGGVDQVGALLDLDLAVVDGDDRHTAIRLPGGRAAASWSDRGAAGAWPASPPARRGSRRGTSRRWGQRPSWPRRRGRRGSCRRSAWPPSAPGRRPAPPPRRARCGRGG